MSKDRSKEAELEDLQRRARSLQGTPEQIIKRRDRAVLLHQIAKYSERSPHSIKKFLDLNVDSIVELHQTYEQLGRKELVDSFRKLVEDLVNPIRADKTHAQQIDGLIAKLSGATAKSSQVEEKSQPQPSSTTQLLNGMASKADILSSASVANPLAGIKAASVVRADSAGLINAKPKQEQVAEKQKKPGFIDIVKNKLKI